MEEIENKQKYSGPESIGGVVNSRRKHEKYISTKNKRNQDLKFFKLPGINVSPI